MLEVFALYDVKAAAFSAPFVAPTIGAAKRLAHAVGSDQETSVGRYPDDYTLMHLGEYDDTTGRIAPINPLAICTVAALLVRPPSPSDEVDHQHAR